MIERQSAIAILRETRDQVAAAMESIEDEFELDPTDRTPYPLLCCMCRFRGEDRTEIDFTLPSIFDGYSCHHDEIKNDAGRQEAIRRFKSCFEFRKKVRI